MIWSKTQAEAAPGSGAQAAGQGEDGARRPLVTPIETQGSGSHGNGAPGGGAPGGGAGSPAGGAGGGGAFSHAAPEGHAKKVSEVLGEIVWLMSQSPLHRQFYIQDLEWFVMTPILLQQFRLFYAKDRPMGVVLWASVDDETASRLAAGTNRLRPQDWKSGDKIWAVEVIAPFGGAEEMIKDFKEKVFPTRPVNVVAVTRDGKKEVRVV